MTEINCFSCNDFCSNFETIEINIHAIRIYSRALITLNPENNECYSYEI